MEKTMIQFKFTTSKPTFGEKLIQQLKMLTVNLDCLVVVVGRLLTNIKYLFLEDITKKPKAKTQE